MTLFQCMEEKKLPLDIVTCSIFIEGMCKAGNLAAAKELFLESSLRGLQPNVRTCTIMINGLLSGGLVGEALTLFGEMEESVRLPNSCMYNTMVRGLVCNRKILRAVEYKNEMVARGFCADASTAELFVHRQFFATIDPKGFMRKHGLEIMTSNYIFLISQLCFSLAGASCCRVIHHR
ncbi:Pentatricopeptide repeat [Trema orientale]|uniref:Pentatricopeptide repeat n=1 Tax=Trema orientale TaxID=63057 RepID=A0A2P5AES0_TREOI|nr:Pentatricopeptide repeat [Trema orientale]